MKRKKEHIISSNNIKKLTKFTTLAWKKQTNPQQTSNRRKLPQHSRGDIWKTHS